MNNVIQIVGLCQEKISVIAEMIPVEEYSKRISEIDHLANSPTLWNEPKKAATLMKERKILSNLIDKLKYFQEQISFYQECIVSLPEELDDSLNVIGKLYSDIIEFEFKQMFKDPIDDNPAILSINAGAGGLEAANWVNMLLRMYVRYADNNGFKVEILDMEPAKEHSAICIDSVSIRIEGTYAYGFFKSESGVHRLIRNSPFSSADMRHTSFAAVNVSPDIEDSIEIEILDKDIEISAQRAGGPGGQNTNKVNSACRIKHLPTGINILARSERDFPKNKKSALKILKSKLYDLELKKREQKENEKIEAQSDIAFGHQVRSYVETPNSIIKDHRTGCEARNFNDVMDGNIHEFILAFLRQKE